MATDGHGTTLSFAGLPVGNLISVQGVSMSNTALGTTNLASGTKTFIASVASDYGTLTCVVEFDGGDDIPLIGTSGILAISYAASGTWTTNSNTIMTGWSTGAAIGERMTASITFKISGSISGSA